MKNYQILQSHDHFWAREKNLVTKIGLQNSTRAYSILLQKPQFGIKKFHLFKLFNDRFLQPITESMG